MPKKYFLIFFKSTFKKYMFVDGIIEEEME